MYSQRIENRKETSVKRKVLFVSLRIVVSYFQSVHTASKRYANQNQVFDSAENYDMDDTKDADKNEGGRLLCRYCDRRFRYPSQLKDHMQSHNGQRPYMCTECGMEFMKVVTQIEI